MSILQWVEEYLYNLPPREGDRGGGAIYLLDVYGTDDTKVSSKTTFSPRKRPKRSSLEIEQTLKNYRSQGF